MAAREGGDKVCDWQTGCPLIATDVRKRLGGIDSVHKIMRSLPEAREPFWKTFVDVAKANPGALRYIVMQMALYLHLGPFSKRVISEIDRRIAELDGMHPVRDLKPSARPRPVKAAGNNITGGMSQFRP